MEHTRLFVQCSIFLSARFQLCYAAPMARRKRNASLPSPHTATVFTQEAMRFGEAASQLAVASGITIGHRLPQFVGAAFGLPAAQAEVRHAVMEKWTATLEAHMATSMAMMQFGWSFALGSTSQANVRLAADVAHAAMAPASRRAKANATRLTAEKRKA
jgi:hypothetical protein